MKKLLVVVIFCVLYGCSNMSWPDATYIVDGVDIVDISYADEKGNIIDLLGVQLPWEKTINVNSGTEFLYVRVKDTSGNCNRIDIQIDYELFESFSQSAYLLCNGEKILNIELKEDE